MIFDNSVILDIEATDGVPRNARIIEVGLVVFKNGKKVMEWERLINPDRRISKFIQGYIGITNKMVENAPKFQKISQELFDILQGKLLIAHNAFIDLEFLQKEFCRLKIKYNPKILCSLKLSQRVYPIFRKHGLDSVVDRLGIKTTKRHRALGDVLIVQDLLQQMQRDFGRTYLQSNIDSVMLQINRKVKLLRYV